MHTLSPSHPTTSAAGALMSVDAANRLIGAGTRSAYAVAGDEALLRQLRPGNWIGGTIPYFMATGNGGTVTRDQVLLAELPLYGGRSTQKTYSAETLSSVGIDAPRNGYSFVLLPGFSDVHLEFGQNAPNYADAYVKPLFGWVAGIHLDDLGKATPKVFSGLTASSSDRNAVVLHVELPDSKNAIIDIVNIFEIGDGPVIHFPTSGFVGTDCTVDGQPQNFAAWCTAHAVDGKLPLMADCSGAAVNVCIQAIDAAAGRVSFYGPLFAGVDYRFARPVDDYVGAFGAAMAQMPESAQFACNCILNFQYGELEGKTAGMAGPVTFGEIAYQLLNQTMVHFDVVDV